MNGVDHPTHTGLPRGFGIVGRERELAALRESLLQVLRGHGGLALISGEAGIGKTALVQACATMAEEHDALVLSGCAYDLTITPPYGPWRGVVPATPTGGGVPPGSFVSAMRSLAGQTVVFDEARAYFAGPASRAA